ncbi:MAG: flavodoxin family protein [Atribacterota bacterium]|nr:flavodoxin family protein [Atribacterota bacterium]MDD4895472.1 flavodoxin family protein [Atribacterota bacterium]MDD5637893.1 flavodoxin family protein [Atribacterota bacterium]
MTLKVVGIVGSPRKGMNTDTLVTKALEGAISAGAETEKIYLNDLEIMPCQACVKFPAPEYCFYHDGMDKIYQVLVSADALIIGAPAYFGSISAQLKLLIDRSNCLAEMITLPDGKLQFKSRLKKSKKGIFIWVANISTNPEHALVSMKIWSKYFANVELVDNLVVLKSDFGKGARKQKKILEKAFQSGVSLGRS